MKNLVELLQGMNVLEQYDNIEEAPAEVQRAWELMKLYHPNFIKRITEDELEQKLSNID